MSQQIVISSQVEDLLNTEELNIFETVDDAICETVDDAICETVDNDQPSGESHARDNPPMTTDESSGETEIHDGSEAASDVDSEIIEVSARLTEKAESIVNFIEMCKSLGEGINI